MFFQQLERHSRGVKQINDQLREYSGFNVNFDKNIGAGLAFCWGSKITYHGNLFSVSVFGEKTTNN